MIFRKDDIRFKEGFLICFFMVFGNMICAFLTKTYFLLFISLLFVALAILNKKQFDDTIMMDEEGITCRTTEEIKWKYAWEDIAELRKITRFRSPSIEIIVYVTGEPEKKQLSGNYFQLSKKAKKALKTYYDKSIGKTQTIRGRFETTEKV